MADNAEDVYRRIEADVGDALATAVQTHEHGLVTRWICLIESIGPDGTRGLWKLTSDGVMAWDTVGILQHALHLQIARTLRARDE